MSTSQECNYINCYLFDLGFNPELKVVLKYNAILLPQYPLLNRTMFLFIILPLNPATMWPISVWNFHRTTFFWWIEKCKTWSHAFYSSPIPIMSIAKFLKQTIFGTLILRPNYDARHLGKFEIGVLKLQKTWFQLLKKRI